MKKILFITTGLETGGAEQILVSLIENLDLNEFKPSLMILGEKGTLIKRIEKTACDCIEINFKKGHFVLNFCQFYKEVIGLRPDIIQGWMYHGSFFAFVAKLIWPFGRCLFGIRNQKLDESTVSKNTLKIVKYLAKFSKYVDWVIYPSKSAEKEHILRGFDERKTKIVANGCNVNVFVSSSENLKDEMRKKWQISESSKVLAYISRFHPHKDPDTFFKSVAILVKKYPDLKVLCAGQGFVCENEELKVMLSDLSIEKQVILVGVLESVIEVYQVSDGLVLSSIGEAFPNVILEAMSCDLPVVTTNIGDIEEILQPFGGWVPAGDKIELAKMIELKIINAVDIPKEKRRSWVKENYSIDKMQNKVETIWKNLA